MLRFFLIFPKTAARILFSVSQNLTFFASMKKSQYFCRLLIFKIVFVSRILWMFCLFLKGTVPVNFIKQIWQFHRNLSFYSEYCRAGWLSRSDIFYQIVQTELFDYPLSVSKKISIGEKTFVINSNILPYFCSYKNSFIFIKIVLFYTI